MNTESEDLNKKEDTPRIDTGGGLSGSIEDQIAELVADALLEWITKNNSANRSK